MKTYPIQHPNSFLYAFEVSSVWITFRPLYKILRSVEGVSDIKRNWFKDSRVKFKFHGEPFVVHEPWGDSSRYWIGPENDEADKFDITPLHQAFQLHRRTLVKVWSWFISANDG